MSLALAPSYWQQIVAGLAVIIPTLIIGAVLLGWFANSVLGPRAAGRYWPEGPRGIRPFLEVLVDMQRRPTGPRSEVVEYFQAVRFGLVVVACAVIPVSTGLVLTQPGLGLYVLPVVLAVDVALGAVVGRRVATKADALADGRGNARWDAQPDAWADATLWVRLAAAGIVALGAGVVHAQWGTGSLPAVVSAQVDRPIAGLDLWGLPTGLAHPLVGALVVIATYLTVVAMAGSPLRRRGGLARLLTDWVDGAWLVAVSAWLVGAFAGGGAVPWGIDDDGTRQVVSVAVFSIKVTLVAVGLVWARATWPRVTVGFVRTLLGVAIVVGGVDIAVTLTVRHLV